jgi:hypothetical protein
MPSVSSAARRAAIFTLCLSALAPLRAAVHVIPTHPFLVDWSPAIAIAVSICNHTVKSVVCDFFQARAASSAARARPRARARRRPMTTRARPRPC